MHSFVYRICKSLGILNSGCINLYILRAFTEEKKYS